MAQVNRNVGFDGRTFLEESEWRTYLRRKPVRYIRRPTTEICDVCGAPAVSGNPLQSAHVISFDSGVVDLALTPDFLDSSGNIVTAHRCTCNRAVELDLTHSMLRLRKLGITELPKFLPPAIHDLWSRTNPNPASTDGHPVLE